MAWQSHCDRVQIMPSVPRIWIDYRPVRIGWVIPERDITRFTKAAAWSSCLWGGSFNPVIPIDDLTLADRLVKTFALDVLIPIDATDAARTFIERFPYLTHERWHEPIMRVRGHKACHSANLSASGQASNPL
jgi:hypothetical protein